MAITVDWPSKVITIPRADMLLVQTSPPIEIREFNLNDFRLDLKDLEDDSAGIPWPTTHNHVAPLTISGVTLARVVEIINGYTITFEDGQYAVNVTGGNSNVGDVININNVSVRIANSAGLQDASSLQASSFTGGAVTIKQSSIYSGTTFPVGTRQFPVNNLSDALSIANARGLHIIRLVEDTTFSTTDASNGFEFIGDSAVTVRLTLDPGTNITNCEFRHVTITGTLDGNNGIHDSVVESINFFNGSLVNCKVEGPVVLGGGIDAHFINCSSGYTGAHEHPNIDMGGTGQSLAIRDWSGPIHIENCSDPTVESSFDMDAGLVHFDTTITNGTYTVRGIAKVVDDSTGSAVVNDETVTYETQLTRKLVDADEVLTEAATNNWSIIDPDDGVTVLRTRTVLDKDGNPITIPAGAPARRTKS